MFNFKVRRFLGCGCGALQLSAELSSQRCGWAIQWISKFNEMCNNSRHVVSVRAIPAPTPFRLSGLYRTHPDYSIELSLRNEFWHSISLAGLSCSDVGGHWATGSPIWRGQWPRMHWKNVKFCLNNGKQFPENLKSRIMVIFSEIIKSLTQYTYYDCR